MNKENTWGKFFAKTNNIRYFVKLKTKLYSI